MNHGECKCSGCEHERRKRAALKPPLRLLAQAFREILTARAIFRRPRSGKTLNPTATTLLRRT